ncbi:uncharacterized protein PV09_07885 [Verruconis gallopava]|uniref:Amine oxidase domain-containing protein n=1 Tax=Verruconis gallopava TaxID=253628 RepID=A0A0D1YI79_9PEZI|nr:uncharacterized protein PV09_07885 [Verruconis gallopava]KIW00527.1 hypothetical protein PV09_07885 [Verruconis gallopava]
MPSERKAKQRIAVVGSGMAGLVTAYLLHQDPKERYEVTVFESGASFSLDSASVSVLNEAREMVDRIDVPMRAFAEGYYKNLIRMYRYIGVRFKAQRFIYAFENHAATESEKDSARKCYFIHSSNNHVLPPIRPEGMSLFSWLVEVVYVAVCYLWWSFCCHMVPPQPATRGHECESLEEYTRRICLPSYFLNSYLLPLMSSVATCSHAALLQAPARDLTEYKRQTAGGNHYTVSGVHEVQSKLEIGFSVRFSATVSKVEVAGPERVKVTWKDVDGGVHSEIFAHAVLAVAPEVVAKLFQPLEKWMKQIPTTTVRSLVRGDGITLSDIKKPEKNYMPNGSRTVQTIHFRTSTKTGETESTHVHPSGAMVTTCPFINTLSTRDVLSSGQFQRALRTPRSRRIINTIFNGPREPQNPDEKPVPWRNGDDNVWLVGGWCWDGMVLLEGCVVSAMRVASALDVAVPWSDRKP